MSGADETRRVAAWAFDQILVMLHPLMPFITEELWSANERPYELIVAKWPEPNRHPSVEMTEIDGKAITIDRDRLSKNFIEWTIEIISEVRGLRAEMTIPWSVQLKPVIIGWDPGLAELLENNPAFDRLAKLTRPETAEEVPSDSAQIVVRGTTIAFPLKGIIDIAAEKTRLSKGAEAAEKERDSLAARLANPAFTERAKPEAVDKARADHEAKSAEAERLRAALERLG